jgi:3alpha(or 20beta)-hydroxysteroid dehydrogenase
MNRGEAKMARLRGKVALITGAAGGQGAAEAELFLREEAAVALTDIDSAAGEALAQRLSRDRGKVLFLRQDVADEASWKETVAAAVAQFGKLHILVNNAGTIARQGIVDTAVEAWNRTLAVNLTGPMLGMKHCAPAIRDSGGGSIINISSTAGLTAHDDAAYTASKWGLRGLTKTAVLQFSQWNIRVNSIHPGQIADTGFYRSAGPTFSAAAGTAIPMQRQGTPRECAELVLFLASDEASFISGAEIAIDGGYIAAGLAGLRNRLRQTSPPAKTERSATQTLRAPI